MFCCSGSTEAVMATVGSAVVCLLKSISIVRVENSF